MPFIKYKAKDGQIHSFSLILGFDELKKSVDKVKAKVYFENAELQLKRKSQI